MRYSRNLGILAFFIATVVLLSTSLFITSLSVSDTDPSTYVIVPTLMLPLFVLFCSKAAPDPQVGRKDIAVGSALFAAFILGLFFLRFFFSFFFVSFRVDLLLMPLAMASLAILLFGTRNLAKFRGVILYALFASPLVLFPLLEAYGAFTSLNTVIIYGLLKPIVASVQYAAPITISANGYNIGIGQACVSIGIFMALALFLVPIAYLYDGKDSGKLKWVVSGIALLFVLNILRMLLVSYAWLSWGPSSVVALIHEFAGVMLFYVVIIVMVIAAGKYGLALGTRARAGKKRKRRGSSGLWPAAIALAFALIYAYSTLNYASALNASPIPLANQIPFNFSNPEMAQSVAGITGGRNVAGEEMVAQDGTFAFFTLSKGTTNASAPIVMVVSREEKNVLNELEDNASARGVFEFMNGNGVREEVSDVASNGTEFFSYRTDVPIVLNDMSSSIVRVYLIIPIGALGGAGCIPSYESAYAVVLNAFNAESYNATARGNVMKALCISEGIVWSR
jgi:exosortase/archaeosortase family protein